jgi:hypothetical protein
MIYKYYFFIYRIAKTTTFLYPERLKSYYLVKFSIIPHFEIHFSHIQPYPTAKTANYLYPSG